MNLRVKRLKETYFVPVQRHSSFISIKETISKICGVNEITKENMVNGRSSREKRGLGLVLLLVFEFRGCAHIVVNFWHLRLFLYFTCLGEFPCSYFALASCACSVWWHFIHLFQSGLFCLTSPPSFIVVPLEKKNISCQANPKHSQRSQWHHALQAALLHGRDTDEGAPW